jgi:hypothetical protein
VCDQKTFNDKFSEHVGGDGHCDPNEREIWLVKQDVQRMQDTYIHEVLHATEELMGEEWGETKVRFIAACLGSALRDAPCLEDDEIDVLLLVH